MNERKAPDVDEVDSCAFERDDLCDFNLVLIGRSRFSEEISLR